MISMQIENAQAVQDALSKFEQKISKKIVRQGVRAAWTPLLKKSKENAKANVGGKMGKLIAKYFQLRAWRRQKKGQYAMLVRLKADVPEFIQYSKGSAFSIKTKKQVSGSRAYIPVAIEYGHAFPYRGGSGAKDVAAIPFMRPALDAIKPKAVYLFKQHLIRAIHEENQKR